MPVPTQNGSPSATRRLTRLATPPAQPSRSAITPVQSPSSIMTSLLFVAPGPLSTAALHLSRATIHRNAKSSFTGASVRPFARTAHPRSTTMLLGIPRVFGRSKNVETVETVQAEPPAPTLADRYPAVGWAKAHPFQLFAIAYIAFNVVKMAVTAFGSKQKTRAVTTKASAVEGNGKAVEAKLRAVPMRHETTEEAMDLLGNTARKYIIVGGKGGVGKTSMSAAVATQFADRGQTTLIVSTDPAHSLSDAFGQSVSGGDPVPVMGIDNLYAQEVNPEQMKRTFKMMSSMDGNNAFSGLGMDDMGLDDLNSLFETLPPGFDEAVALVEIVKYIQGDAAYAHFERIVFDTAPTGHTLRLLSLPDFLNGFFGKIISMKSKFGNVMNQFKGMFGSGDMGSDIDSSMEDMEELKRSMAIVRDLFRDEIQTEFIVATIPNMMAIAESSRLVEELRKEMIPVRHLFVNQVQPSNDDCTFCAARHREQSGNLRYIAQQFDGLQISTVQCFDKEIQGAAALRTMGMQLFPRQEESENNVSSETAAELKG